MQATNEMRAFISHNRADSDFCIAIANRLKDHGVITWLDEQNLTHGELTETIMRQIQVSNVFIPIFSPSAFASDWVLMECKVALNLRRREPSRILIPVTAQPFVYEQIPSALFLWEDYLRIEAKAATPTPLTPDDAVTQLLRYLELLPRDDKNEPSLIQLQAGDLLQRGRALLAQGKYEEAFMPLATAAHADPALFDAWYCKGTALGRLKHLNEALAAFDRARLLAINEEKERIKKKERASDQDHRPSGWYGYGFALMALERYDEALSAFNSAISLDPQFSGAVVGKGMAQDKLGRPRRAIRSFDQALEIDQLAERAAYGKGKSLQKIGRKHEALLTIEHAIATDPDNPENWIVKADMLASQKDRLADAEECYRIAIRLLPDTPHYHKQASEYWTKLGDLFFVQKTTAMLGEALKAYQQACKLHSQNVQAWRNIISLTQTGPLRNNSVYQEARQRVDYLGSAEL